MERQLANLTGLVQKALTHTPTPTPREFLSVPPGASPNYRNGKRSNRHHVQVLLSHVVLCSTLVLMMPNPALICH